MSNTFRYDPETHEKARERRHVHRRVVVTKEDKKRIVEAARQFKPGRIYPEIREDDGDNS